MYDFAYHRAADLEAARQKLTAAEDGKLLAGGMTLIPTLKQRLANPSDLIDLGGIATLRGISEAEGKIVIGAMTPHAEVAADPLVRARIPALAALAEGIGDPQVRNRGTIGGSVANADPAADYPAALLGLGATVITDRRQIAADDFFTNLFETALEEHEIVISVAFPIAATAGYAKFPNPASRYAIVGVFVAQGPAGLRVAVTGAGPCAFRQPEMEDALARDFSAAALQGITVAETGLNADIHAGADYRAHLIGIMAKRALAACG